jgi:hypothetical protein
MFARGFPSLHPSTVHAWRQGEMTYKEPCAARELMGEGGDPRERDLCCVGMGGEGGVVCDTEGFEVVVGEEVEGEAEHGSGDIAREAGRFTVVVGEVFADFSVDIVGGEEGVGDGAREFGPDGPMDEAMLGCLVVPLGERGEDAGVVGVFIGDEHEGVVRARGCETECGEQGFTECPGEGAVLEGSVPIETEGFHFLRWGHRSCSTVGGMAEIDDELRMGGEGDGDIGGEELGAFEGDKAVDADIVGETGVGEDATMETDGLTGESFEPVGDETEGKGEGTADGAQALPIEEAAQERVQGDGMLEVIGETEGLGRKGGVTARALVALHPSKGLGMIASFCMGPSCCRRLGMPDACRIGTEGKVLHR